MRAALISLTENGRRLTEKLSGELGERFEIERFCFYRRSDEQAKTFENINALTKEIFQKFDAIVFVTAAGIAVRSIAPFVVSKTTDPAVITIDERGKYVIPLLSGHLGGANRFAEIIAEKLGAVPVITTATDIGKRFSPDSFAKANSLIITDLAAAKTIAAAVLDGEKIGFKSDYPYSALPSELSATERCRTGICITADKSTKPFSVTLTLIPKNIVVGIGCKKGVTAAEIEQFVHEIFMKNGIDPERIFAVTSIDIKSSEPGLIEFCEKYSLERHFYSAEQLMTVDGEFSSSQFVLKQTGCDNVCERSAAFFSGTSPIVKKSVGRGVTVAACELPIEIDFERKMF